MTAFDSARDEMQALFNDYWKAQTPAVNGGVVPRIEWQGVDPMDPAPPAEPFARYFLKHVAGKQTTFGPTGQRRFNRPGLITVQVFAPLSKGQGLSLAEKLGIIARDSYEGRGTASGIWFRNARIQEIGPSKAHYQFNMIVEFRYDDMR